MQKKKASRERAATVKYSSIFGKTEQKVCGNVEKSAYGRELRIIQLELAVFEAAVLLLRHIQDVCDLRLSIACNFAAVFDALAHLFFIADVIAHNLIIY